ncbi:hypothetical protein VU10_04290 [Desulfobulbus sp. US1]|nr:hypothetical protein [Desulfobulbus sp. US1]
MNSEDVHPYNKKIVTSTMENRGIRVERCDFLQPRTVGMSFSFRRMSSAVGRTAQPLA